MFYRASFSLTLTRRARLDGDRRGQRLQGGKQPLGWCNDSSQRVNPKMFPRQAARLKRLRKINCPHEDPRAKPPPFLTIYAALRALSPKGFLKSCPSTQRRAQPFAQLVPLRSEVRGPTPALPALLQVGEHLPRNFFQGFKHSGALEGDGFDHRLVFPAKMF